MRGAHHGEVERPGLGFWARRRAAVAEEARREANVAPMAVVAPEAEGAQPPAQSGEAAPERSEEEILAALGLPDPDAMRAGDDFAAFMSRAVPEALRRRALRRLWTTRPVLANLDRLVDYDDDYTGGGVPMGTLPTAYRVGRGLLARVERLAEAAGGTDGAAPSAGPAPADADAGRGLTAPMAEASVDAGSPRTSKPSMGKPRSPNVRTAPLVPPAAAACEAGARASDAPADPAFARDAVLPIADAVDAGTTVRPAAAEGERPGPVPSGLTAVAPVAPDHGAPVEASMDEAAPLLRPGSARRMRFEFA